MARKKRKRPWGRGSIEKRGQGMTVRWREKQISPDGKIRFIHRSQQLGEVTISEAMEVLRQHKAVTKQPVPVPVKFSEFASNWKANVLPLYPKYSTRKHHAHILDKKLDPFFKDMFLDQITTEHVQQFVRSLEIARCAPHSIHHYHTVLSTIFGTAKKWKRIAENPAHGVLLPVLKPVREQWVFTYDEAHRLLGQLRGRARVAVALALSTGMRRGELFAARWKYFDSETATLWVTEAIYDQVLGDPKTGSSRRLVPLPAELVELLKAWRSKTKYGKVDDFILAGRQGIAGDHVRLLRDHIKPACTVLKLRMATWLTFRRTWATWADAKGVSAKIRGSVMGNSEDVNQRIYTKVIPTDLRQAVDVVGSELYASCTQTANWLN